MAILITTVQSDTKTIQ